MSVPDDVAYLSPEATDRLYRRLIPDYKILKVATNGRIGLEESSLASTVFALAQQLQAEGDPETVRQLEAQLGINLVHAKRQAEIVLLNSPLTRVMLRRES